MLSLKLALRAFLPAILVAVPLVVACGDQENTPTPSATFTKSRPGTPPSTPLPGDASAALVELSNRGLGATYKVTYQTLDPQGEEGDGYVVYNRPPLTRIDTIPPGSSEPSSLLIGSGDSATISCSGGPKDWECSEAAPLDSPLLVAAGPVVLLLSTADIDSLTVTETEGRTIAGQASRCFRLSSESQEAGEELQYCLNAEGVPLYSAPLFGTTEATEFSVSVSDEDFEPPAQPEE